jgi:hypothetical protein
MIGASAIFEAVQGYSRDLIEGRQRPDFFGILFASRKLPASQFSRKPRENGRATRALSVSGIDPVVDFWPYKCALAPLGARVTVAEGSGGARGIKSRPE